MKKVVGLIAIALLTLASAASAQQLTHVSAGKWFRYQPHVHVNWVDKISMAQWYQYHGYNAITITELNHYEPVEGMKTVFDSPGRFLIIPGTEPSTWTPEGVFFDTIGIGGNMGKAQAAWNAIRINFLKRTAAESLDAQHRVVRENGGVPIACHPSFNWAFTDKDILKTDPKLVRHFEVRNGEHGMNDFGGGGHPSTEEMWDRVLSTGRQLYGHAVDDSHHIASRDSGQQDFFAFGKKVVQAKAMTGRTSLFVRAKELTENALLEAIENGNFYSTVHLTNLPIEFLTYDVDKNGIKLTLPKRDMDKGNNIPDTNSIAYKTWFIGKDGKVLKLDESYSPSYQFKGDELYVRVKVQDSDGGTAFGQPVFIKELR